MERSSPQSICNEVITLRIFAYPLKGGLNLFEKAISKPCSTGGIVIAQRGPKVFFDKNMENNPHALIGLDPSEFLPTSNRPRDPLRVHLTGDGPRQFHHPHPKEFPAENQASLPPAWLAALR